MSRSRLVPSARYVFRSKELRPVSVQTQLERQFFKELRLPNGTYKTTAPGRLAAVDSAFLDVVVQGRRLQLLDVAISSGVTTLDWLNSLAGADIAADITATDVCLFAFLRRTAGVDLLIDGQGCVLQVAVGSRGICRPYRSSSRWLPRLSEFIFFVAERVMRRLPAHSNDRVPLVSAAVHGSSGIGLVETDIAHPPADDWRGRFDGIRAANILHRSYFTDRELRRLVDNLIECLRPSGVLIIGRTNDDGENHFSLIRKEPDGELRLIGRVGGGADIESILLSTDDNGVCADFGEA